jgi:hypothetical protein
MGSQIPVFRFFRVPSGHRFFRIIYVIFWGSVGSVGSFNTTSSSCNGGMGFLMGSQSPVWWFFRVPSGHRFFRLIITGGGLYLSSTSWGGGNTIIFTGSQSPVLWFFRVPSGHRFFRLIITGVCSSLSSTSWGGGNTVILTGSQIPVFRFFRVPLGHGLFMAVGVGGGLAVTVNGNFMSDSTTGVGLKNSCIALLILFTLFVAEERMGSHTPVFRFFRVPFGHIFPLVLLGGFSSIL